ncbi:hypothetical protein [Isoptericola sp. NPDC057559]|uniref:hypothetical protein n=1 Tax=Isoptericola sp. NPDC057559 TaxID=3346168 RepID=UPI0036A53367
MSDDVVEFKVRFRRRSGRIALAVVAVLALLVAWWAVSGTAAVAQGSAASSGVGHGDDCDYPDEEFWAVYAKDETPVAVQTVRNEGRWPVEVISTRPEAYRFSPVPDDPRYDATFPSDPLLGAPPDDETSDRVTIPPGREASMWIIDPFRPENEYTAGGQSRVNDRTGVETAPVQVWSLGIRRDADVAFYGTLWQSTLTRDSEEFKSELAQLCES